MTMKPNTPSSRVSSTPSATDFLFSVHNGLTTFGPEVIHIIELLESRFLSWARTLDSTAMLFPPLMEVKDLEKFDYFINFPHLALLTSRIHSQRLESYAQEGKNIASIPQSHLVSSDYVLPSAACYNIYLHLRETTLTAPKYVTTVAQCFRNEAEYPGLQRLWGFRMREIVCIGSQDDVQTFLDKLKAIIQAFVDEIQLPLHLEIANDPFYDMRGRRALMQQLSPVKFEFVYDGSVAIASANFHRNFFGERCNIRTSDGAFAFSGCIAFGIERWLHALFKHFGDADQICKQLVNH